MFFLIFSMTNALPLEVVIAGMTLLITFNLDEAISKCGDYPGAYIRTALGHS